MTVGERIKNKRIELGLTQMELAQKMGYSTKSAICNIEKAGNNITSDRIKRFAAALECSPADLMGWDLNLKELPRITGAPSGTLSEEIIFRSERDKEYFNALKKIMSDDEKRTILEAFIRGLSIED